MPKTTKSKSKSTADPVVEKVIDKSKRQVDKLQAESAARRDKSMRRDSIFNSVLLAINTVLGVLSAVQGKWTATLFSLFVIAWLLVLWNYERLVDKQRYTIDMLIGINDIQTKAMLEVAEDDEGKK